MLVPNDVPLRVGPNVSGRVYVLTDGKWVLSDDAVKYQEGWYIVPPNFVNGD